MAEKTARITVNKRPNAVIIGYIRAKRNVQSLLFTETFVFVIGVGVLWDSNSCITIV